MRRNIIYLMVLFAIVSCKSKPLSSQETQGSVTDSVKYIDRWEAGVHERVPEMSLVRGKGADWKIIKQEGITVAVVIPVSDYYERAAFQVNVDKPPVKAVWLTIEYLDKGFGLISVSPEVTAVNQWGVARLNTGKIRHAYFRFEPSAFAKPLKIYGLEYLHALWLSASEPIREPLPDVQPAFTLSNPMELPMGDLSDMRNDDLSEMMASMRNKLPLVKALGFNSVETYVRWNVVEHSKGIFDWSYYDSTVAEIRRNGLKWFPPVIIGPAYTLPDWFYNSKDHLGFMDLEYNKRTDIQTFFSKQWPQYVHKFLSEFGKHYDTCKTLLGARTGVTGVYGEPLYPTGGEEDLGFQNKPLYAHNGWWAGGKEAEQSFRTWLGTKYASISDLNKTWRSNYKSFDDIKVFNPDTTHNSRQQLNFCNWYMGSMSDFSDLWNKWFKEALPNHPLYATIGGNDRTKHGADFVRLARDAANRGMGVRVTNESDDYMLNFAITRLLSTAARFYGARFGLEPAGFATARGVVGRLYNAIVSGADHLFYYAPNLFDNDQAIDKWLRYAPLLDHRANPITDVAVFYPNTSNKLDKLDIWAEPWSPFYIRVQSLRSITDCDFASEQMILDGILARYKVLVILWGDKTEKPVLERIATWVKMGGTLITPLELHSVEGENLTDLFLKEDTASKERVIHYKGISWDGAEYYLSFVRRQLKSLPNLNPQFAEALRMEKPATVYWSVLQNGQLALLNFDDEPATVRFDGNTIQMEPYSISLKLLTRKVSAKK